MNWHAAPAPFNPEYREGFGTALEAEYITWSNAHPDHSFTEGIAKHREIADRIRANFPSVAELAH